MQSDLRESRTGMRKTYTDWVEEHWARLFRIAWALGGDYHGAQDAVQETLLSAWRAREQLRNPGALQAWLFQILRRELMHQHRQQRPTVEWETAEAELPPVSGPHDLVDAQIDILKALQKLRPGQREILVLFYLEDLRYEEIAAALGIPVGTVMSRLSRAREALRMVLSNDKGERDAQCG